MRRCPRVSLLRAGLAVWAAVLSVRAASAAAAEPSAPARPGEEFPLRWEPVNRDLPVYVPSDYTAARRWPVVVLYHGLDGEPTTGLIRQLTAGRGAIVVGMEYLERRLVRRTAEEQKAYQAKERAQLEDLLRLLPQRLRVDRSRIYLAGVSQGGWQVSAFAESAEPRVAGYLILLAGRFPRARAARGDERTRLAQEWVTKGLVKARDVDSALACYAGLERLADDPRQAFCGQALQAELATALEQLRMASDVQAAWQARHVYERALWQEQTADRRQDLEEALALYRQAAKRYPETAHGRLAAREAERVKATVEPTQPRTKPRLPPSPRVRSPLR